MSRREYSSSESELSHRDRRSNTSDQSPPKRQRHNQRSNLASPTPSHSPPSTDSTASISRFYGIGDEGAAGNLFASYPQTLTTFPRPHGSQGDLESLWGLRYDHEIHLLNDFPPGARRSQCVRVPILGPDPVPLPCYSSTQSDPTSSTATAAEFQSALSLVRGVIGEGRVLTAELALSYERVRQWRERWGWSPLSSGAYESPPPYSPTALPAQRLEVSPEASDELSEQSSSPSPEPIPNPTIPGDAAPTAEILFDRVNTFAKDNGFGIVRRHAYSYKGQKVRYTFQCDRFGEARPSEGAGIRQRKSRKCGCKWKVIAEALEEGKWLLRQPSNPEHNEHNHERSMGPSAHPSHRRLTAAIRATVEETSRRVGVRARDVRAVVQKQHPESVFTRRDIYNARSRINRDKMNGYTPTAALIKLFDERQIPYIVKWADDDPNRLLGLVWSFPHCLEMWKRFPEVISFDNTYNTNRFKLPLFQATGQTCLGSVFNAAFGLIDNERREGFQFLSESIRQLLEQHSIRHPDIIITDFDDQMKAALDDQFPEVQQQLCIHHINSNVLLRSKQKWVANSSQDYSSSASNDGDAPAPQTHVELSPRDQRFLHAPAAEAVPHTYRGVLSMWKLVVFAETEDAHENAWANLCREFDDQRAILLYLHGTYMPVRAQWARCFIRKYRNFGIRVTSGTEASNNNVKSYLLNGRSHLHRLVEAIEDMIKDQERDFADACAADDVLTAREYLGSSSEYLGDLRTTISSKGLGLITKQYLLARKAMPTGKNPFPASLGSCGEDCSVPVELGVPCCHIVYSKIVSGTRFTKWDVHPRWHIRASASRDPYRRILDPRIAIALRGRPKNTPQAVPARLAVGTGDQSCLQPRRSAISRASQSIPRKRRRSTKRQNEPTLAGSALEAGRRASGEVELQSRRQTRSQSTILGAGRGTGVRASGRRTQASIRRRRSQWELVGSDSDGIVLPSIVVRT